MEISSTELRKMTRWLGRNKFLKFKILDENYIDLFFNARFKISKIEIDGIVYGMELEIETNTPFALKEPRIINIENTIESGNISVSYVWGKYKTTRTYEITKSNSTESKPNDCDSVTYANYEITNDGYFELSGESGTSGYCYLSGQTANAKSIYKKDWHFVYQGDSYYTYQLWTLDDTYTTKKGDFIEYVSSENRDIYPDDGVNGEYWYVYEKTEIIQNKDIFINDTSHEEGYIYPHTEITIAEDGDLNIHNAMEDRSTYIANCVAGEVITMDYPVITSSLPSHNIQNDFNWCFFRVANTYENSRNDLTISIPCTMKVKYSPIVKVGL